MTDSVPVQKFERRPIQVGMSDGIKIEMCIRDSSQLPAQRTGTQHCSIRVLQLGSQQLGLTFVDIQYIVVKDVYKRQDKDNTIE